MNYINKLSYGCFSKWKGVLWVVNGIYWEKIGIFAYLKIMEKIWNHGKIVEYYLDSIVATLINYLKFEVFQFVYLS